MESIAAYTYSGIEDVAKIGHLMGIIQLDSLLYQSRLTGL